MDICSKCGGEIIFRVMDDRVIPIHLNGSCNNYDSPSLSKTAKISLENYQRVVRSQTIPNATCPVCGKSVFYYQNEHGSKVFFDALGPPWPKHPCTDNSPHKKKINKDYTYFEKVYVQNITFRKSDSGDRVYLVWELFDIHSANRLGHISYYYSLKRSFKKSEINLKSVYMRKEKHNQIELSFFLKNQPDELIFIKAFKDRYPEVKQTAPKSVRVIKSVEDDSNDISYHIVKPNKQYSCKKCGNKFSSKESAEYHKEICGNNDTSPINLKSKAKVKKAKKRKPHKCTHCKKSFYRRKSLETHIKLSHSEFYQSSYNCKYCSFSANSIDLLKKHLLEHRGSIDGLSFEESLSDEKWVQLIIKTMGT
jgi:hypothetical protein